MAHQTSLTNAGDPIIIQVWVRLPTKHRGQVIRLMAQLAFQLVLADTDFPFKEVQRVVDSDLTENPD